MMVSLSGSNPARGGKFHSNGVHIVGSVAINWKSFTSVFMDAIV